MGRFEGSKIVQFLVKHRGIFHSFTFCILISVILAGFFPVVALGFFLGYSLHLLADSFTAAGIRPFWPSKISSSWKIKTGGLTETSLFAFFLLADLIIFIFMVKSIF